MSQLPKLERTPKQLTKSQHNFYSNNCKSVGQLVKRDIPFILVTPQEIKIQDFQIKKEYQFPITIKNMDKQARRIRVIQPKTSKFRCDYDMTGQVAPGLSVKMIIYFESQIHGQFYDVLKIISEDDYQFQLNLHALPPQSNIQFENNINLGFVQKDKEQQIEIIFQNKGKLASKVEIVQENLPLQIRVIQQSLNVQPENEKTFNLIVTLIQPGVYKHQLQVKVDGQIIQKVIDINGTCVEHNRYLVNVTGGDGGMINFQPVYFGKKCLIDTQLFNNSSNSCTFRTMIIQGTVKEDFAQKILSPIELGIQQTQKIMICSPNYGQIQPYSSINIQIFFDPIITEKVQQFVKDYAFSQNDSKLINQDYSYTLVFEFKEQQIDQTPLMVSLNGKAEIPAIKISQQQIDFGDVPLNQNKDILVYISNNGNINLKKGKERQIDICFQKQPFIFIYPEKSNIDPLQTKTFVFTFQPQKIGKYKKILNVLIVDQKYQIPILINGNCNKLMQQTKKTNKLQIDFQTFEKQFNFESRTPKLSISQSEDFSQHINYAQSSRNDNNMIITFNKQNANQFLKSMRDQRVQVKTKQRYQELQNKYQKNTDENDNTPPLDIHFYHANKRIIKEPEFQPYQKKEDLFVLKPIGEYKSNNPEGCSAFNPDPSQKVRRKFQSEPRSYAEDNDCNLDLSGEDLQKIFAGPKYIDFGIVFIKSVSEKYFSVRNDLSRAISMRLIITHEEVINSYQKLQIIPAGKQAGFDLVFSSKVQQQFIGNIKYIINNKYEFSFQIQAQVEPVKLEIQKEVVRLSFQEDSIELFTTENLRINNNGNSIAVFQWLQQPDSIFSVTPQESSVKPGHQLDCQITYSPKGNSNGKQEEEKLTMKIMDGIQQSIQCIGIVNESKCQILEKEIDLGEIPVCKRVNGLINIKNLQKLPAVFNISPNLPAFTEVFPMKGKLGPDQSLIIKVIFYSKNETRINQDIIIQLRGGKEYRIPFSVVTSVPNLNIIEPLFDFGSITTLEESGITIENNSQVPARLLLDLREESMKDANGIECLDVIPFQEDDNNDQSEIIKMIDDSQLQREYQDDNGNGDNLMDFDDAPGDFESGSDDDASNYSDYDTRLFIITVKPKRKIKFKLKFMPKDVRDYNIYLPLTLLGYGKLPNLYRQITCKGIKPKFIMRPNIIEFKKKIVMQQAEKCFASFQDMTITNPENRMLSWKIDTSSFNHDKYFQMNPSSGRIDGGQNMIIKVSFNPTKPGEKQLQVPLYLDNDFKKPYCYITLKGQGSFPRLTFDRREIILPPVPLNIQSDCTFQINNDGYENLILKHQISQEFGNIDLNVNYIEGNQIGVQKQKLKVQIQFQNSKPISFSLKLEFLDESLRSYPIYISGSTDNCYMSTYSFIQRSYGTFQITGGDQKPLQLVQNEESDNEIGDELESKSKSQKSFKGVLGYNPVPPALMEKNLDCINRWINQNVISSSITLQSYPGDVIKSNGSQIFDIVEFLTGKKLPSKIVVDQNWKRNQRVNALLKQYEELIKFIKENGGLLNDIRPHFLLGFQDFMFYLQTTQNNFQTSTIKINESQFGYISNDAWMKIYYQIIKCFYLIRIDRKYLKQIPNLNSQKDICPNYYLEGSNLIQETEGILMRWLELNYEIAFGHQKRLYNFDDNLKNCLHIAAAIQNYIGKSCQKYLTLMKKNCQSDEDFAYNSEKLIQLINDVGFGTHFIKKDFIYCSSRETIIFLVQLYQALPNYIPKLSPIIFECVLGDELVKEIELNNPTSKVINYWVSYDGKPEFSIKNCGNADYECVQIMPKQRIYFKVKFTSRISASVEGRLTFTNKKDGNIQASALVFELKSLITERKSMEFWSCKAQLYKQEELKIQVTNIFNNLEYANFEVQIINIAVPSKKPRQKKNNKNIEQKEEEDKYIDQSIPGAFFIAKKDPLKIKKGEKQSLMLQFMPFKLENYKCLVIFVDPLVGEFQHEIQGETLLPDPPEEIRPNLNIYVDQIIKYDIQLPFKNQNIINLRKKHENRLYTSGKLKEREDYNKLVSQQHQQERVIFDVDVTPPNSNFVTISNQVVLVEKSVKKQSNLFNNNKEQQKGSESENKIQITFQFKNPIKEYVFQIIIKNAYNTDIRIFKVFVNVNPKPMKAILELKVALGDEIKQEIPLFNPSDKDVNYKALIEGEQVFTGAKDINIKKGQQTFYSLFFKPTSIGQIEGKLQLINTQTNDNYEYKLMGITEDPIAQDHLIINCMAKKPTITKIPIQNKTDKQIIYQVETDLLNSEGLKSITINPGKTVQYQLKTTPIMGGTYMGSITFQNPNNKSNYIWFSAQMNIERSQPQKTIEIQTVVRKPVVVDINIQNQEQIPITFDVIMQGEGLQGDNQFTIPPKSIKVYELMYLPIQVGTQMGMISFLNQDLGEIWHNLLLTCEPANTIKLQLMQCGIGQNVSQKILIENPINQDVTLKHSNNNLENFSIFPKDITLKKFDSAYFQIQYTPTLINEIQVGELVLSNSQIGNFKYQMTGQGLPPTIFNETKVIGVLDKEVQCFLSFKNPFCTSINVNLVIESKNKDSFQPLGKQTNILINALQTIQIAYNFYPKEIKQYNALFILKQNDSIQFKLPVNGISEMVVTDQSFNYSTICKQTLYQSTKIFLPGIPADIETEDIQLELTNIAPNYKEMVKKSLQFKPFKRYIEGPGDYLLYDVVFEPQKPCKLSIDLVLKRQNGGQWKFKAHLQATEPEHQDVINIYSQINKSQKSSLSIKNTSKELTQFKAYFENDYGGEFQITPRQGEFDPLQLEQTFIIQFTPKEYRTIISKLIIESNDNYWSYMIKGTFPKINIQTQVEDKKPIKEQEIVQRKTKSVFFKQN